MKKNTLVVAAVLFSVLLLTPVALSDVYVPPGPGPWWAGGSFNAWASPTLMVIDRQDNESVGWIYSDTPMWDNEIMDYIYEGEWEGISPYRPLVWGKTAINFSSEVVVFGWIPEVYVSPDQVPPPVEIVITWNGVPYLVTLTLPSTQVVGKEYPPHLYADRETIYEFAYPAKTAAHYEKAYYNIWYGDIDTIRDKLPWLPEGRVDFLPWYFEDDRIDYPFGYYFWYRFHPNTGDFISYDCQPGKTKHPPTYDITALFEYETSQIWFNHVAFDVRFLEVHKTITPNPVVGVDVTVTDTISIKNTWGEVNATQIDIWQTYPEAHLVTVNPMFNTATARLKDETGRTRKGPTPLLNFDPTDRDHPFKMPAPFDKVPPGWELSISMELHVTRANDPITKAYWNGTIVFDLEVSAFEIPPWKYPRSMDGLVLFGNSLQTPGDYIWEGWFLDPRTPPGWTRFYIKPEWRVPTQWIRDPDGSTQRPMKDWTLDPVPVDLNGDGLINAQDVALVRQAIVGLTPYDHRMDINVNNKIDTQDLAAYKLKANA